MMVSRKRLRFMSILKKKVEYYLLVVLAILLLNALYVNGLSPKIPFFEPRPNNVSFNAGETATLLCSVQGLQTRFVVWRRMSEPTPLTIGDFIYSPDDRISIRIDEDESEWNLIIKDVDQSDAGVYECAVSSREKYKRLVLLRVFGERKIRKKTDSLKPQVIMSGNDFISKGSRIFLTCNATGDDFAPDGVDWFINGHIVNHRTMPRARIYYEVDNYKRTLYSTLEIRRSYMSDKGIYVCRGPDAKTDMVTVHILDEEKSIIEKRGSMNDSTNSCWSLHWSARPSYIMLSLSATWLRRAYLDWC